MALPFDGESSPKPTQSSSVRGLGWGELGVFPRVRWVGGADDVREGECRGEGRCGGESGCGGGDG